MLLSAYPGRKNAVVSGGGELFLQVLKQHPEILQQILSTVLNVIMYEDCRNQWSMSRPLLGLILLNEEVSVHLYMHVYINKKLIPSVDAFFINTKYLNANSFVCSTLIN